MILSRHSVLIALIKFSIREFVIGVNGGSFFISMPMDWNIILYASVKPCSLIVYKTNWHKRPPTLPNREFQGKLFKTHWKTEKLAFSICSLFGRVYAISACGSLGKVKTQKNPAIKDWIIENKKMVGVRGIPLYLLQILYSNRFTRCKTPLFCGPLCGPIIVLATCKI